MEIETMLFRGAITSRTERPDRSSKRPRAISSKGDIRPAARTEEAISFSSSIEWPAPDPPGRNPIARETTAEERSSTKMNGWEAR